MQEKSSLFTSAVASLPFTKGTASCGFVTLWVPHYGDSVEVCNDFFFMWIKMFPQERWGTQNDYGPEPLSWLMLTHGDIRNQGSTADPLLHLVTDGEWGLSLLRGISKSRPSSIPIITFAASCRAMQRAQRDHVGRKTILFLLCGTQAWLITSVAPDTALGPSTHSPRESKPRNWKTNAKQV